MARSSLRQIASMLRRKAVPTDKASVAVTASTNKMAMVQQKPNISTPPPPMDWNQQKVQADDSLIDELLQQKAKPTTTTETTTVPPDPNGNRRAQADAMLTSLNDSVSNLIKQQRADKVNVASRSTPSARTTAAPTPTTMAEDVERRRKNPSITTTASTAVAAASQFVSLTKYMAQQGLCSRREAQAYLDKGWVLLNGRIPTRQEYFLDPNSVESVSLTGKATADQAQRRTILLHKPLGVISCQPETEHQIPAIQLLTAARQYHSSFSSSGDRGEDYDANNNTRKTKFAATASNDYLNPRNQKGWAVAGRLDVNSTGLLVLTQSGNIARELIRPDCQVEKEYLVRIPPLVRDLDRKLEILRKGVKVQPESLLRSHRPTSDKRYKEGDVEYYEEGQDEKDRNKKRYNQRVLLQAKVIHQLQDNQLKFVLTSGITHQIRRMCEAVALPVQAIKRVRIGNVVLGDLPLGQWKYLPPGVKFTS